MPESSSERTRAGWTHAAIIIEGTLTLIAVLVAFPFGVALVVTNAVLAVVARGITRKLFAGCAIAGAALCVVLSLSLVAGTFR
jgi:hypothetical protein